MDAEDSHCRAAIPKDLLGCSAHICFLRCFFNVALFSVSGGLALYCGWAVALPAWLLMGIILAGFLNAAHDCAHGTLFRSKATNRFAGRLWSTFLLTNFAAFKYSHLTHHKFSRKPGDTESLGNIKSVRDYLVYLLHANVLSSLWSLCGSEPIHPPSYLRSPERKEEFRRDRNILRLWVLIALGLTILYPKLTITFYWLPIALFGPTVAFFALPEHHGLSSSKDPLLCTRTVFSNKALQFILWNGGFHAEHHFVPSLPSWNLPRLHAVIGARGLPPLRSYLRFHLEVLRSLINLEV
jgi:fatty acid desaturase